MGLFIWSANRLSRIAAGLLISVLSLSSCTQTQHDRYEVTVEINDNGNIYRGSSVQELGCRGADPAWRGLDAGNCVLRGEAVFVDIPGKGVVVMPFASRWGRNRLGYIYAIHNGVPGNPASEWYLARDYIPMLVTFPQPDAPASVYELDSQHLDKYFGSGVTLKSVGIRKTDREVRFGRIKSKFQWLNAKDNLLLSGKIAATKNDLSEQLSRDHFFAN